MTSNINDTHVLLTDILVPLYDYTLPIHSPNSVIKVPLPCKHFNHIFLAFTVLGLVSTSACSSSSMAAPTSLTIRLIVLCYFGILPGVDYGPSQNLVCVDFTTLYFGIVDFATVFTPQPLRAVGYYFHPWCLDGGQTAGKSLSGLYLRNC